MNRRLCPCGRRWPGASRRRLRQKPRALAQVGDEIAVLTLLVGRVLDPQQERGMNGDERGSAIGQMQFLAAYLGDHDRAAEQAACGSGAERDDGRWLYDGALDVEPNLAALDLMDVGAFVQAP